MEKKPDNAMIEPSLDKTYNPAEIEQSLYTHWEKSGYFRPNGDTSKDSFCVVIPPPNVTGSLHMGHAFQQTIMDTMIRYQRMRLKKVKTAMTTVVMRSSTKSGNGKQNLAALSLNKCAV